MLNLENQLHEAEEQLKKVTDMKRNYQLRLERADKLVKGLAGENQRWNQNVKTLEQQKLTIIGDSLLAAQFVSYIGPFTANFRMRLWNEYWVPDMVQNQIPFTKDIQPLQILTSKVQVAQWKNQGLPEDLMSLQNASIVASCQRWPLIVDPQLQGTNWLKGHYQEKVEKEEKEKQNSQSLMDLN